VAASETPVLILTGAPGVGKTTIARALAARSNRAVHLESDLFFSFIRSGFVEPWRPESQEQNAVVMRIVAEAAASYAEAGYFTIVDGIVLPRWFLGPVGDSLREAGHAVAFAVLRAPLDVCVSRVRTRASQPLSDHTVVERLWQDFADLGPLEAHAIDVAGHDPGEAAGLLAERLGEGSLAL
jgi:tRNA uridine 5-carbamoylmethylation protein Kti12